MFTNIKRSLNISDSLMCAYVLHLMILLATKYSIRIIDGSLGGLHTKQIRTNNLS